MSRHDDLLAGGDFADLQAIADDVMGLPSRSTLRVLDMDYMLSTAPPPVPYAAKPMLVKGNTTMLGGREGQGKSMFALAVGAAIGNGATIAGIDCDPGRVLYVDAENGPGEIHRRVRGLGVRPGTLIYVEADGFDLRRDFGQIEELVDEHQPTVLMLDSLRSLAPGLQENESGPIEEALRPVVRFTQQAGLATLILHHAGKNGEYRGSTAIGAAVELGFTLSREDADPEKQTRRKLECWKCRPAAEPPTRWVKIGVNAGGRILLDECEPYEHEREAPVRDGVKEALLLWCEGQGATVPNPYGAGTVAPSWTLADLARAVGRDPKDGTVRRAVADLTLEHGLLRGEDGRYSFDHWAESNGHGGH